MSQIEKTDIPAPYLERLEKANATENLLSEVNKSEINKTLFRQLIKHYADTLLFNNWLRMCFVWDESHNGQLYWRKIALLLT